MRSALLLAPALLAACAASPPPAGPAPAVPRSDIPVHGETPGRACRTTGTDRFIGQAGTSEAGSAIRRTSNAAVLRWAPPGTMMTMDFRADRVTVYLGPDRKVTQIKCG